MERIVNLHIEKLPEGFYLATSEDVPGLVAQGRTISETVEIAKDVAKKIIESHEEQITILTPFSDKFELKILQPSLIIRAICQKELSMQF